MVNISNIHIKDTATQSKKDLSLSFFYQSYGGLKNGNIL